MGWDRQKLLWDGTDKYVPWEYSCNAVKQPRMEVGNGAKPYLRNSSSNFCQTTKTASRRQCRWPPFHKNPISTMRNRYIKNEQNIFLGLNLFSTLARGQTWSNKVKNLCPTTFEALSKGLNSNNWLKHVYYLRFCCAGVSQLTTWCICTPEQDGKRVPRPENWWDSRFKQFETDVVQDAIQYAGCKHLVHFLLNTDHL